MVQIRIVGTVEEVDAGLAAVREVFDVVEVSAARPRRGDSRQVSRYVEARMPAKQRPVDGDVATRG